MTGAAFLARRELSDEEATVTQLDPLHRSASYEGFTFGPLEGYVVYGIQPPQLVKLPAMK